MQFAALSALLLLAVVLKHYWSWRQRQEVLDAIAREHGCLDPPLLENQRPLGVDRLEQIFRASAESRLMELFLFHFRQTGYTLKQIFLLTPAYGTVDPANLEAILSTKFEGEDAWKRSKLMLRPQLVHRQYEDLKLFDEPMDDLLDSLPSSGGIVDLQALFFRFTLDVTTAFLLGESIRSLKSSPGSPEQNFAAAFDLAQSYIIQRFRLLDLFWLIGGRKFYEACRQVNEFADKVIEQNLRDTPSEDDEIETGRYIFLRKVAKSFPDRAALRGQIVNILVAGRDTTACLLSWTFYLLVRHPKVMEKVRAEISALGDAKSLTRDDLRSLKYLQNVLKEVLRLYPSVPVNTRTAVKTTVLPTGGGPDRKSPVLVPAGSAVAYSVYTMHRRPDLYGLDAELFRPERWDEDLPLFKDRVSHNYGYLPFSGGPRICLGMDFALTEAAYTIVCIFQRYPEITLPEGEKAEVVGLEKQTVTLVLQITDGCKVKLGC
ncbi:cytochrome P450 alkane hydroxylase [Lasiosphaeris hirsuta]|uniref:Cytochrome P450 alkane hydroxylase n=1 Tax=Lasiosphaeris hirsuta TaxID=260670 RepID=A0AA40AF97_9PEZI|nr:cytochrome P450 alkane hydroxylase [Lasiosphaeris hirsuta]